MNLKIDLKKIFIKKLQKFMIFMKAKKIKMIFLKIDIFNKNKREQFKTILLK